MPGEAANWTDDAAGGLDQRSDLGAYLEWKSRLRTIEIGAR